MSQKYYIVVNANDLPCDSKGQTSFDNFPGAFSYERLGDANAAAMLFTQKNQESYAVYCIVSRFVYQPKVEKQEFT